MQSATPTLIGDQYALQEVIGSGGMGTVYRALDMHTGENVAVKLLKADAVADDPDLLERFSREAEALRQLNHPNIVRVLTTIEETGRHYIVMEYVSGGSLSELMRSQPQMPVRWVLKLAIELADALTRAHYLKIIHRDIKPANVLIAADGTPRLTDFGVAQIGTSERVTRTGNIVGTPDYLPPEALNGDTIDNRSDIWSFGVMLFEMLAGQRPFIGMSLTHLITQILTMPAPDLEAMRPDVPVALIDLIYRMLEKDHDARIPSVRLVGAELEAIMQGDGSSTSAYVARRTGQTPIRTPPVDTNRFAPATPVSDGAPRHNLPAETTPFIGRESELRELERLLQTPANRLVTILGAGGMGKTRLSLQTAQGFLTQYPNGVYFVALAPLSSVDSIVPAIADAVGYTFTTDARSPHTQLLDFLREKQMLLVMDNFEHLIQGAGLVGDILGAAPGVKVLATSRERLNLSGETIFVLEGMDFPDWETPADALEYSAVRLFQQSARRARPDFAITADDLPYVARICRLVMGMPLGIVLAAAWVEALPLQEIADEISRSLDFLETELRDVPDRHRSLRAVFDYSWNLLSTDDQETFMRLSVFQGGFSRQAAQEVTGTSLRSLTSLVNKSLLRRDPDTGRYSLHVMLHQYASEKFMWCCGEGAQVVERHLTYYAGLLRDLEPKFNTDKENAVADQVDDDLENFRQAWQHALTHQRWTELDQMQRSMLYYYLARSMLTRGIEVFRELADALELIGQADSPIYWRARSNEAWIAGRVGDYDRVVGLAEGAVRYFEGRGNALETCLALNNVAYAYMMQGLYPEAEDAARQAIHFAQMTGDTYVGFMSIANLGYALYLHGQLAEARSIYEDLNVQTVIRGYSPTGRAFGVNNLGEIAQAMGDLAVASRLFAEAHETFKAAGHLRGMAFTFNNLAGVYIASGEYQRALEIYREAYRLNKEIGDRSGIGHSLSAIGNAAFYQGDYAEAGRLYQEALTIRRQIGDRRGIADSTHDLGDTHLAQHEPAAAARLYAESLTIRRQISDLAGQVRSLVWLAIARGMNPAEDRDQVFSLFKEAETLAIRLGSSAELAQVQLGLGEFYLAQRAYREAKPLYDRVLKLSYETNFLPLMIIALTGIARVEAAIGDPVHALELATATMQHPRTDLVFMAPKFLRDLVEQLRAQLPADLFEAARARGEHLDLNGLIEGLLAANPVE